MENYKERLSQKIKDYVKSLNRKDNTVYQCNELLIMSCFNKCLEIIEEDEEV